MAQNKGIIKIHGLLDGKVFYRRNGKDIVQSKGGFNGDRIKSEERYEKTRQLGSEFGRCATQASVLKNLLQSFLASIPDTYIYNWIQSMVVQLKNLDAVSSPGARNASAGLQTDAGKKMLANFQFNRHCSLQTVLTTSINTDLKQGKITLKSGVVPFVFSKTADYAAVQLLLLRMDFDSLNATLETSECCILPKGFLLEEDLILEAKVPDGEGVLMGLLSVRFLNETGEEFVFLRDGRNVLGVVGIF